MDRRSFLALSTAAAAAGYLLDERQAAALQTAAEGPSPAEASILGGPPVLQAPAPDGVTVFQAVRGIATGWVEFGTTPALGQRADNMRHGLLQLNGLVQRVRLAGLQPGTTYFYRVGVCPIEFKNAYKIGRGPVQYSPVCSFRTLDDVGTQAGFLVINDTHENMETLRLLSAAMAQARARLQSKGVPAPGLTFWNGDIFNDVRSDQQVAANVLTPPMADGVPGAPAGYASSWPMCFVSGNHDVRGIHARSLELSVDTPGGVRYGVIRHGPVAFIVLDTGEDKPDGHPVYAGLGVFSAYRDMQRAWLQGVLSDPRVRTARHRVVVQHIPMWGGGSSEDAREKWAPLVAQLKPTVMLSGHTHTFAFTPPDAAHAYPQLVGGGPAPEAATLIEGHANGDLLTLTARNMSGAVLGSYELRGQGA
ncbi:MAG: FN3 domain-containing metallophosphoesterase family protein [Phycisphaerales bacterium]